MEKWRDIKKRQVIGIVVLILAALAAGSALAWTYTILRGDDGYIPFGHYDTIVPESSSVRSTPGAVCSGDFSPSPCAVNSVPEPSTFALFGLGLVLILLSSR